MVFCENIIFGIHLAYKCNIEIPPKHPSVATFTGMHVKNACERIQKASLQIEIQTGLLLEAPTRFELVIKVLQTSALPLGDGAEFMS